jgi:hypothetical protein
MVAPMDLTTNYFDWWNILLYEVVGNIWLLIFIGLAVVIFMSIKYAFPLEASLMMTFFWVMIVVAITSNELLWVFVVTIIGFISFWIYSTIAR